MRVQPEPVPTVRPVRTRAENIIKACYWYFGWGPVGPTSKVKEAVLAREAAAWMFRNYLGLSWPQARKFLRCDIHTVIDAARRWEKKLRDPQWRDVLRILTMAAGEETAWREYRRRARGR